MTAASDLAQVIAGVAEVLERRGVRYFITGSLAASAHAEFRATNDVDVVADFTGVDVRQLVGEFQAAFVADSDQALASVEAGGSFNLIHKASFLKVDFFPANSAFNQSALERAELLTLRDEGPAVRVATREDILLAKLRWYRLGGEESAVQRRDIEGIIALNREQLNRAYVAMWATELGVADLLERFIGGSQGK